MNRIRIGLTVGALLALAGAPLVGAHEEKADPAHASATAHQAGHADMDMKAPDGASGELHQAMMNGMDASMKMTLTGNVDRDFATMMIQHHRQAIEMAKIEIAKGGSAELKAMAQKMVDQQQKEIEHLEHFTR